MIHNEESSIEGECAHAMPRRLSGEDGQGERFAHNCDSTDCLTDTMQPTKNLSVNLIRPAMSRDAPDLFVHGQSAWNPAWNPSTGISTRIT